MDSTDDGFYSGAHDLTGDEESTRKSLQSRERELKAICDQLWLSTSKLGKTVRKNLDEYSKTLVERGITEVSRAHIMECHARQVLKQDDLKALESNLYNLNTRYAHLLETSHHLNTLHKKAIKSLQNETEKNKKNLDKIQPFFSRADTDEEHGLDVDGRTELMRRAALAVKKLSERKQKQLQEPAGIIPSAAAGDSVLTDLAAKTEELELLNKRLEELGFQ